MFNILENNNHAKISRIIKITWIYSQCNGSVTKARPQLNHKWANVSKNVGCNKSILATFSQTNLYCIQSTKHTPNV